MDGLSNFVVTWSSEQSAESDNDSDSIHARRFNSVGVPLGGQFQVNTYTTGSQLFGAVGADATGNFVIVWSSYGSPESDTDSSSIQGQSFDSAGNPTGGEFQVNTYTTNEQPYPHMAMDEAGRFVVAWASFGSAGSDVSDFSIQAQRFAIPAEVVGQSVAAGGTVSTDSEADGATQADSVETTVTSPNAGSVSVEEYAFAGQPPAGFQLFNLQVVIAAPVASSGAPLILQFQLDASVIPSGEDENTVQIFKDGTEVASCSGAPGEASPDPCVAARTVLGGGDMGLTVLSSTASTWTFGVRGLSIPGRIAVIKPSTFAKFVAKPTTVFSLPAGDPLLSGGSLRVFDVAATAGDNTYNLPSGGWKGLGKPAGSKGYKYKGAGTPSDPCKVVLLKPAVIKGVCKGAGIALTPPFDGDVGIILSLGTTDRYCAQFGGDEVKNDDTLTKRKNAPAPGACP
jgi:hypothetical protein